MRHGYRTACALALLALAGAGQTVWAEQKAKGASAKEQVWQVEFAFGDEHYTGSMTLVTKKGVVTGTMLIDSPSRVEGQVEGQQTADALTLDYAFRMIQENCTGRVQVNAKFAAKGQEAAGTAHVSGCSDAPMDGTVTMKKAPKTTSGTR